MLRGFAGSERGVVPRGSGGASADSQPLPALLRTLLARRADGGEEVRKNGECRITVEYPLVLWEASFDLFLIYFQQGLISW